MLRNSELSRRPTEDKISVGLYAQLCLQSIDLASVVTVRLLLGKPHSPYLSRELCDIAFHNTRLR